MAGAAQKTAEPTREDLALLESLETRARIAIVALDEIYDAFEQLKKRLKGLGWMGWTGMIETDSCLHVLQAARVAGGRWGFSLWWWYRVHIGNSLQYAIDACESDQAIELRAVERAMKAADPDLIATLDRAASDESGVGDDDYAAAAGMAREEVEAQAEAVISKLIESGWRP